MESTSSTGVGKAGYALLGSHVQVLQVVLTAGGDIELDLLAAAVHCPLHTPQVGDEGPQLHPGDLADGLEDLVGVRHLGDRLGVHERAYLNDLKARIDQTAEQGDLFLGGKQRLFVLEAVAQANLTQGNGRG